MVRKILLAVCLWALFAPRPATAQAPRFIVFFAEWSGALDDAAQSVIRRAAATTVKDPTARLTVTGYADNKGTQAANQFLSDLRAQVVVDALHADGVPVIQIGTGPSGPLPATGVIGRRVEITLARPK